MWPKHQIFLFIFMLLGANRPLAGQALESNEALRQQYLDQRQGEQEIYGSTPITHISPAFNTITYSLGFDWLDYTVLPDSEDPNYADSPYSDTSLRLEGYQVLPHLSVSLRSIGLGFTAGRGEKKISYQSSFNSPQTSYESQQSSQVSYTEVGLFSYFMPFPKIARQVRTTMILGGRSINAKHKLGLNSYTSGGIKYPAGEDRVYRYNVSILEAGFNIRIQLLRRFSLIPWADYRWTDTNTAESIAASDGDNYQEQLKSDLEVFWQDHAALRYGIDFAIRFDRFQFNIGGLLGSLVSSNNDKESFTDDSIVINLSFDQKGN